MRSALKKQMDLSAKGVGPLPQQVRAESDRVSHTDSRDGASRMIPTGKNNVDRKPLLSSPLENIVFVDIT